MQLPSFAFPISYCTAPKGSGYFNKSILLLLLALTLVAQDKKPKTGLYPEDWKYTLAPGVTSKEVIYYSDGIACYARIFFPRDSPRKARRRAWFSARVGPALTSLSRNTVRDSPSAA